MNIKTQRTEFRNRWSKIDQDIERNEGDFQNSYIDKMISFINPLYGKDAVNTCNNLLLDLLELEKDIRNYLINNRIELLKTNDNMVEKSFIDVILNDTENRIKLLSGIGTKLSVELSINNSKFAITIAVISLVLSMISFFIV